MNIRKSLDDIKAKISQLSPENLITGIVINGVEKDSNGDVVIVNKHYIPFCEAGGEAWHEDYPIGDPRRIKLEYDQ